MSSCPRRLKNGLDNHFSVKCFPRKITQDNTGEIEVLIITVKTNRITKLSYKKIFKSGVFTHWWLPQTAMFLNPDLHKILWLAGNYSFLRHFGKKSQCLLIGFWMRLLLSVLKKPMFWKQWTLFCLCYFASFMSNKRNFLTTNHLETCQNSSLTLINMSWHIVKTYT